MLMILEKIFDNKRIKSSEYNAHKTNIRKQHRYGIYSDENETNTNIYVLFIYFRPFVKNKN